MSKSKPVSKSVSKSVSKLDVPEHLVAAVVSDLEIDWTSVDKKYDYILQSATMIAMCTHNPVKYDSTTGAVIGLHNPDDLYALPGYEIAQAFRPPVVGLEGRLSPPVVVFKRPESIVAPDGGAVEVMTESVS